jgi:hypothetical protein
MVLNVAMSYFEPCTLAKIMFLCEYFTFFANSQEILHALELEIKPYMLRFYMPLN